MRKIFVIGFLPRLQCCVESGDRIEFSDPDQILLDRSDDSFRVGIPFGIVVTGENLRIPSSVQSLKKAPDVG